MRRTSRERASRASHWKSSARASRWSRSEARTPAESEPRPIPSRRSSRSAAAESVGEGSVMSGGLAAETADEVTQPDRKADGEERLLADETFARDAEVFERRDRLGNGCRAGLGLGLRHRGAACAGSGAAFRSGFGGEKFWIVVHVRSGFTAGGYVPQSEARGKEAFGRDANPLGCVLVSGTPFPHDGSSLMKTRASLAAVLLLAPAAFAEIPKPDDAPRPLPPAESANAFHLPAGLSIRLLAGEPLIREPSGSAGTSADGSS